VSHAEAAWVGSTSPPRSDACLWPRVGGRCLDLTLYCGPAGFRDVWTAVGSGGAGASLRELRLHLQMPPYQCLPLEGVAILPGSLPQLHTLSLRANGHGVRRESVRSLLLAPGGRLERLDFEVWGVEGHVFEAIADEVSTCAPGRAGLASVVGCGHDHTVSRHVAGRTAGVAGVAQAAHTDGRQGAR
jgi:hypothetical protein